MEQNQVKRDKYYRKMNWRYYKPSTEEETISELRGLGGGLKGLEGINEEFCIVNNKMTVTNLYYFWSIRGVEDKK